MKNVLLLVSVVLISSLSFARETEKSGSRAGKKPNGSLAANCSPATQSTELDINNVRALIQTGGDMWWDFTRSQYEIPKNSGQTALFAGSLWMGGRDISGQLKVAAQMFRSSGVDFWTGPLSLIDAEIDPSTCVEYDKHFPTSRAEVSEFVGWFEAGINDAANGTSTQSIQYPGYSIPKNILDYPAKGRSFAPYNEAENLAPFADRNGDGDYDPTQGDYPAYDLNNSSDCKERIVNLFGDQNLWWIFNDKGNIHTETGASSIGMEIRAQAFAFATNDEINNMTFYNYELVNRSTFTLTDTYFGQWVDADLGCSADDYVGCDVQRGLGYCYNGDNNDEDCNGVTGYGNLPPAIGIDFFQGPFQDNDGVDNPLTKKIAEAVRNKGIPYKGIGIGYGDGVIDNERFGMRRFIYHNRDGIPASQDPQTGVEFYNYLRGVWRDGSKMLYGGTGHQADTKADPNTEADYMFPGDSDPLGWGTGGKPQAPWTESTAGTTPNDRRLNQSAGPFTLEPGAVNNITVGVVWARATSGNNLSSIKSLKKADDKTQALFDNCFRILSGPDAPNLTIREMENELIIYINNPLLSNNYNEAYIETDPTIIAPDSIGVRPITDDEIEAFKTYRFQGYMIYQLKDNAVSTGDLKDPSKARLIAQVDVRDSVSKIINQPFDSDLGTEVPTLEVTGENGGIRTSFLIDQDAFAEGVTQLVNHRAYYYLAIAYGFNPNSQNRKFIGSRKSPTGAIQAVKGIPHQVDNQNSGTVLNAKYGDGVEITRVEGIGNGGNILTVTQKSIDAILASPDHRVKELTYEKGAGPVSVKVVDPLAIKGGDYTIWLKDTNRYTKGDLTDAFWMVTTTKFADTIVSTRSIEVGSEKILADLGISITLGQVHNSGEKEVRDVDNGFLFSEIVFDDPSKAWLSGIADGDGTIESNWILSGTTALEDVGQTRQIESAYDDWNYYQDGNSKLGMGLDDLQKFEQIEGGIIAPFRMTAWKSPNGPVPGYLEAQVRLTPNQNMVAGARSLWSYETRPDSSNTDLPSISIDSVNQLNYLHGVNIVITSNKDHWTRCPVIEMRDTISESQGEAIRGQLRDAPSVDKEGLSANINLAGSDVETDPHYISSKGMGWFPGYAIDVETGERLNMAFGEDSYLIEENGRDMIWNPTSTETEGPRREFRGGGKHLIYVFRNNIVEDDVASYDDRNKAFHNSPLVNYQYNDPENRMPRYDAGKWMESKLRDVRGYLNPSVVRGDTLKHNHAAQVFRAGMWVMNPLLAEGQELLASDVTIRLRVQQEYQAWGIGEPAANLGILEGGKNYFVNAGPIRIIEQTALTLDTNVFYRGMTISPKEDIAYTTQYKSGREGADIESILIEQTNGGMPMYTFSLEGMQPTFNSQTVAKGALEDIKIVPNPYYAYSKYETSKLDNRIIITNLPKTVTVRVYTINGTLVRTLEKDDDTITFLEWDLKNQQRVPIASGMYIYHINAPSIGETVLKWMAVMRPVDLDNF
ncbi:MAG: hypothetical protein OSB25_12325 [Salibacteraceae bacterium]|nr:hypothetical protein [Salibacteraceae bacterium]